MIHDVAIIGGGILGLATARALITERPELRIVVVEKETELATHQTGHNSGVIHAGLYYAPGSLKARLCVDGRRRLLELCDERGIPIGRCGKVVVATDAGQIPALDELGRRAAANGVEATRLGPEALTEREPHAAGVAALWVSETAVVDFRAVARTYADDAAAAGVDIRTGFEVVAAPGDNGSRRLESIAGWVEARIVVNCAGLHVDRIAELMGHRPDLRIVPFRGEYRTLKPERTDLVRSLIYPVPDPRFPFLGVHFTRNLEGRVEIGPNAILALAREGYRWGDVDLRHLARTVGSKGFLALARRNWRTGAGEMWRSLIETAFVKDASRLVPELTRDDLGGYRSGVRAQAVLPDGTLLQDFAIEESDDAVHVLNAPSPAATASLAIGDHISGRVLARLA